jgi:hypothetical protein
MTVRRLPPLLLALVLGVLAAVAVACGDEDGDRGLLSPSQADAIREELDKIDQRVERGDCEDLDPAFIRLDRTIADLPRRVDRRLRRRLADGARNLEQVAADECRDNRPETTETTETQPETAPETVPETVPTQTETQPPPQTETQPPPQTETQPPPQTQPPDDTGGEQAPGTGFVPPGQAKKGNG